MGTTVSADCEDCGWRPQYVKYLFHYVSHTTHLTPVDLWNRNGKYECFVMQMLYVCVLWSSCGSSQCCVLHDWQIVILVEDARGDHISDFLIGSHECLLLFTPSCCGVFLLFVEVCVRVLGCCECVCCMWVFGSKVKYPLWKFFLLHERNMD